MHIFTIETAKEFQIYEAWVRAHPWGTLWQSLVRKRYVEACGKEARVYVASDERLAISDKLQASALVVIDRTTGGFSTWEIARGPLINEQLTMDNGQLIQGFIEKILEDAKKNRAIVIYFSPFQNYQLSIINDQLSISPRHVHCEATRMIDLTVPEEQILAQMHPKGRYNIAVARRHGVTVREGSANDADAFYSLLRETASRDKFTVSQKSHYTRFLDCIGDSFILMAEHAQKPIAGLIGVRWQTTGIYYYGASSYANRQLMAPYLLQWEAMRYCKAKGCSSYDLMGIEHEKRQAVSGKRLAFHPWAGVSEFKRKFGGAIVQYPPEQMMVLRPLAYAALQLKRKLFG